MSTILSHNKLPASKRPLASRLEVNYVKVSDVRPSARNARRHSNKKIRQLADTIRSLRVISPLMVDENLEILAGHARYEAAKLLKLTEVPTIQVNYLSDVEKRAYRLADNRYSERASWDNDVLAIEVKDLLALEFEIELTGFDTADVDIILDEDSSGADDAVPDVETGPAVTRPGDIFECDQHRLICADARDPTTFQTLLAGEKAELVIADAPYNVKIEGHVSGLGKVQHRDFVAGAGELTYQEFVLFLRTVFILLVSNAINGAIHFLFMDWRHMREMLEAGDGVFSELKNLVVWAKNNGGMGSFYRSRHELVFVYKSGQKPHINNFELGQHGRSRTNVWEYAGVNSFRKDRMEELAMHPTCKPVDLIADAIKDCSKRGHIVLDPFGGSGSTLIGCEKTGRVARLIELDPKYCDVIVRRWQAFSGKAAIHRQSGLTFSELETQLKAEAAEGKAEQKSRHRRRAA